MTFADFFHAAKGNVPYGYQCRLACGPTADPDKPDTLLGGTDCRSQLINIPTGLGKTAAVTLAWLWNRTAVPSINSQLSTTNHPEWPLRLVYCLSAR
jgi:CRISPR-associated endonuclease/helicase Cas3